MKTSFWRSFVLLAAVAGSGLVTFAADDAFKPVPSPTWSLTDLAGHTVSSSQLAGKVVVLDFWATWCGPCRSEIPGYIALQRQYGPAGLVVVGVSLDRDAPDASARDAVRHFAEQMKIDYTIVLGDDRIADAFGGIEAIPTTFIIDRNGVIQFRKMGAMEPEAFAAVVKRYVTQTEGAGVNP